MKRSWLHQCTAEKQSLRAGLAQPHEWQSGQMMYRLRLLLDRAVVIAFPCFSYLCTTVYCSLVSFGSFSMRESRLP
jgi:hypothetical protein